MPVSLSRRVAFEILLRVEKTGAYAGDLLHAHLAESVKAVDAALATEITLGVLRWRRLLDFLLARKTGKPTEALDLEVLTALRIGLYQLRFLDRIPAHAAVSESVELVRSARKKSAAGLVNAVLRNLVSSARNPVELLLSSDASPAERLGIHHSHPTWMVERWLDRFGEARAVALLESNNRPRPLVCVAPSPEQRAAVISELVQAGASATPARWLRAAFIVTGINLSASLPLREGRAFIQDEASQMVALLLDAGGGTSILDLCAAPGGKTALLARTARSGAMVVAGDLHPSRLRQMRSRLQTAGIANVLYLGMNATRAFPLARQFDRILADAPCSGTGTLARNPEIRWRLAPADLANLHDRQVKLLSRGLAALAPGGRLVYSTCSLEPEENENVLCDTLRGAPGFNVVFGAATLAPHLLADCSVASLFDAQDCLRTIPPEHDTDGFFAAVIERSPSFNKR